jgi:hypothetical protein
MTKLETNSFIYEALLRQFDSLREEPPYRSLNHAEKTARWAWFHHPGRFADGALENVPYQAGLNLKKAAGPVAGTSGRAQGKFKPRTLHVVSELYSVGGHTRALARWVQMDDTATHAIVLTRHHWAMPEFVARFTLQRGVHLTRLNAGDPLVVRAQNLAALARQHDRVILHTHPDDLVPVLAFAQPGGCPVAMFNHAHFAFNLGASVADLVINTFVYFQNLSRQSRFARATAVLPALPGIFPFENSPVDKAAARVSLGLPPAGPVAMTIATEYYFKPSHGYDFFATMGRLLARNPALTVLVVGVAATSPLVPAALQGHDRIRFLGNVTDPRPFYRAADLSLESFPMPSLGALIESVVHGEAFPVPVYGPGENIVRINPAPLFDYEIRPPTEPAYVDYVTGLLADRETTRAKAGTLRQNLLRGEAMTAERLAGIYQTLDSLPHKTQELPVVKRENGLDHHILAAFPCPDKASELAALFQSQPALVARIKADLAAQEHAARPSGSQVNQP